MMTERDMEVFCRSAQNGVAMGLSHRYEWLVNSLRMLEHGWQGEYEERAAETVHAFVEFEKGAVGSAEEAEELKDLTSDGLSLLVNKYYEQGRAKQNATAE